MSTFTFKWPKGPKSVIVTGDFDNWSKLCPLVKQADGSFEASIPVDPKAKKIQFKFVIDDDTWLTSKDFQSETDASGNVNNVIYPSEVKAATAKAAATIPESGGLPVPVSGKKIEEPEKKNLTPAVEPKDPVEPDVEKEPVSQAQATAAILKGPGIVIPKDAENISAFKEVRDVDPKTLNEPEEVEEEPKEEPKEEIKEEPKEEIKEEPKEEIKEEPKEKSERPWKTLDPGIVKTDVEEAEPKYVRKVIKKVKKTSEKTTSDTSKAAEKAVPKLEKVEKTSAELTPKATPKETPKTASTPKATPKTAPKTTKPTPKPTPKPAATSAPKSEKRGFLSKLKKFFG